MTSAYSVEAVVDADTLKTYTDMLADLARHAAEPNPSYEPGALIPALRHFGAGVDTVAVLVFTPGADRQLAGLFPMRRRRLSRFLPGTFLELWPHQDCLLSTPLLRRGYELEAVEAFFGWLRDDRLGAAVISLKADGSGPFMNAVTDVTYRRGLPRHLHSAHRRAVAVRRDDAESYLRQAFRGLHLKHFRRQRRLLGKLGELEFRVLDHSEIIRNWLDEFVELESKGWKGKDGCAMAHHADRQAYFREVAHNFWCSGQFAMIGLFLDGRPISLKCTLLSGRGAFAWKVAYDEDYAAFSPGILLEIFHLELLHDGDQTEWMDYCTWPDHPTWNRLALDRATVVSEFVSTGRRSSGFLIAMLALYRFLRWTIQPAARFPGAHDPLAYLRAADSDYRPEAARRLRSR